MTTEEFKKFSKWWDNTFSELHNGIQKYQAKAMCQIAWEESKKQSINEIKALAIEEATDAFVEFEGKRNSTSRWIDDYADKLRKGEKHGK